MQPGHTSALQPLLGLVEMEGGQGRRRRKGKI